MGKRAWRAQRLLPGDALLGEYNSQTQQLRIFRTRFCVSILLIIFVKHHGLKSEKNRLLSSEMFPESLPLDDDDVNIF